ncbi:hypothetical protein I2483_13080 [Sporosarcina sp. E16_3]|uniref:hypothetical protein n=1 Tax=Sporosarcina sp. E16_3 TaxID=2789293 RepID=UPI001A924868|nr:hypothetical protein [Sporosarcina sp. E16_3]MBO0602594.1 hypothetical protein [Sporosarcina sp. E16_3]
MGLFLQFLILILVVIVVLAEIYRAKFENNKESKDERGWELIYKAKSLSYSILSGGLIIGVVIVGALKLLPYGGFIFIMMGAYFIQSIASSIYLYQAKKV